MKRLGVALKSQLRICLKIPIGFFLREKNLELLFAWKDFDKISCLILVLPNAGLSFKNFNREIINYGNEIAARCRQNGKLFLLEGSPLLVKNLDADGVLVDFAGLDLAKKLFKAEKIIGISIKDLKELDQIKKFDLNQEELFFSIPAKLFQKITKTKLAFNKKAGIPTNIEIQSQKNFPVDNFFSGVILHNLGNSGENSPKQALEINFEKISHQLLYYEKLFKAKGLLLNTPGISEFSWIKYVQKKLNQQNKLKKGQHPEFYKEIFPTNDDCAYIKADAKNFLVLSCDTLWEGVHFRSEWSKPYDIGWKGMTAAYSDFAAKGIGSGFALITNAFPVGTARSFARKIQKGTQAAAELYNIKIIGGNTLSSQNYPVGGNRGPLLLDFFLLAKTNKFPLRSGAKKRDLIITLAPLGLAKGGLEVLKNNLDKNRYPVMVNHFLKPKIDYKIPGFISELIREDLIHASMDISDGLVGDLTHILEESDKNGEIFLSDIYIHPELKTVGGKINKNPLQLALSGGEDYAPLFTVAKQQIEKIRQKARGFGLTIYTIGEILPGPFKKGRAIINLPKNLKSFAHF